MNLNDGKTHKIFFSKGKLYLDGVQIGGEGITPERAITFELKTNSSLESAPVTKDSSILEINVSDSVSGKDLGPGQPK